MQAYLPQALLGTILVASLVWDLRTGRIPNFMTLPAIIAGLVVNCATRGLPGLAVSLCGLTIGAGLLVIPFGLGGIGAGDVKLMASVGAVMGWRFCLAAGLYSFLVGGLISLMVLAVRRRLPGLVSSLLYLGRGSLSLWFGQGGAGARRLAFPYSSAIAGGCALVLLLGTRGPLPWSM